MDDIGEPPVMIEGSSSGQVMKPIIQPEGAPFDDKDHMQSEELMGMLLHLESESQPIPCCPTSTTVGGFVSDGFPLPLRPGRCQNAEATQVPIQRQQA